jgi:benzoyl-CoA reductase subunit C
MNAATSTADGVKPIVERAEELVNDLTFASVREWKEAEPGRLAIGFLPVWIPRELVWACGALPVGIVGGGDRLEIVKGDACFQSYLCHLPRSVVELGMSKRLDFLDGMLFPSICDVIRNLSGMWRMLFPTKFVRYVDLPQNFDPEIGGAFFANELRRLVDDLVAIGARRPTHDGFARAIADYDANRALHEELYALRRREPWRVPTSELCVLARAGNVLPPQAHNEMLTDYLRAVKSEPRQPLDNARVAVVGSFCEQPPLDLIRTLEHAGCYVVEDDFVLGARFIRGLVGPLEPGMDPFQTVALAFLERSVAHASVWTHRDDKGRELIDSVKRCGAEGVLFAAPSFCDPALLDQPMLQSALDVAHVPHSSFKYSENTGQFQGIREQAGTFADAIKLWSEA